jgi:hypothetical protein
MAAMENPLESRMEWDYPQDKKSWNIWSLSENWDREKTNFLENTHINVIRVSPRSHPEARCSFCWLNMFGCREQSLPYRAAVHDASRLLPRQVGTTKCLIC